ncbi:hypothetical protein AZI86_04490 [Bdellovibrio bacteriovorus]|uniref:DUF4143 domain-containing protein n=1 Tax=Bdellovibrio bacteriovorus TaxID=959 RepID=A0A150WPU0_BDEBC|nr:DUF4143 domain-containing protein [Bdellovibrio bacteriovorus]KYG66319.1 hypothetical protein AZI86_04490 [Bdellovibrio bacteriovorus]
MALNPDAWLKAIFKKDSKPHNQKILERLFKFSGFPEPYFANSEKIHRLWRSGWTEKIIREDLRDLSRIPELSQVEMLVSLLPDKIGSPLSIQSLREDLEVSHDTVSRWLKYLNELFYFFELKPWTKSIPRSLKKEGKIYLYDWTEIDSPGIKFENMVASHLLKACNFWTDTGEGAFELFYLRNKEKQEIDFLIVRDKKPWLCVEAKYSETVIDKKVADKYTDYLGCPYKIIAISTPNVFVEDDLFAPSISFASQVAECHGGDIFGNDALAQIFQEDGHGKIVITSLAHGAPIEMIESATEIEVDNAGVMHVWNNIFAMDFSVSKDNPAFPVDAFRNGAFWITDFNCHRID